METILAEFEMCHILMVSHQYLVPKTLTLFCWAISLKENSSHNRRAPCPPHPRHGRLTSPAPNTGRSRQPASTRKRPPGTVPGPLRLAVLSPQTDHGRHPLKKCLSGKDARTRETLGLHAHHPRLGVIAHCLHPRKEASVPSRERETRGPDLQLLNRRIEGYRRSHRPETGSPDRGRLPQGKGG